MNRRDRRPFATNYNYFRDYDPSIGRYVESDPLGLQAGLSTYGYVEGSPLAAVDAFGLFEIIYKPGSGPRTFAESREFNQRFKAYRDALQSYADDLERRISKDCVKDRKRLKEIFDKWVVWLDPNILDPRQRESATDAHTNFANQTTQFNFGFFKKGGGPNPGARMTFAHEFRHLMGENHQLADPSDIVLGPGSAIEKDADRWAETCLCRRN